MKAARTPRTSLARGLLRALAAPHRAARLLSVGDSRALVRCLFLSSGIRSGWLDRLSAEADPSLERLAGAAGSTRTDRLEAWLAVGCELRELRCRGGRYQVRGRRTRAVVAGDDVLAAHYASVLDYQTGPYAELDRLLTEEPGAGRDDLERYADEIAQVSLAAFPFVAPLVRQLVGELRPKRVLDAGCGAAPYSMVLLQNDPTVQITGVDISDEVVRGTEAGLAAAGFGARAGLVCADLLAWSAGHAEQFDLIMLHNNIYYFPPDRRVELFQGLAEHLAPHGELLLTTMTRPGSVASAHLHLMLVCQHGDAALPGQADLRCDLADAGLQVTSIVRPVPSEPYVVVRSRHVS